MADYTTITDAQVDPEAPITSELMSALRDNPIAIAEGATGAPKIQRAAIQTDAVDVARLDFRTASYSGSLPSASFTYVSRPSSASFFPAVSGQNNEIEGYMANNALKLRNLNNDFARTWSVSWSYLV